MIRAEIIRKAKGGHFSEEVRQDSSLISLPYITLSKTYFVSLTAASLQVDDSVVASCRLPAFQPHSS